MGIRLTIIFLLTSQFLLAQSTRLQGKVIDANTMAPLAFVHITVNNTRAGTTTDIDGKFQITTSQNISNLTLSYVGYKKVTIDLSAWLSSHRDQQIENLIIGMERDTKVLDEILFIGGENPAHPIIRMVIANKKINNPEKIKSFKYKSYNKFYVDAEVIPGNEDEDQEFMEFIETKYLFMMESVTERKYLRPDRSKETVIANKVSGLKNPLFTTLANSFQPFSFYQDYIEILGKRYVNPLSKGTFSRYYFELKDSIYNGSTKVYIIGFEPRKRNFDGLKGLMYINTYKYAVENVIAETANLIGHLTDQKGKSESRNEDDALQKMAGDEINNELEQNKDELQEEINFSVKIQQKYILVDSVWFPGQLNTDMIITDNEDGENEKIIGVGRSYLSDIELLPEIRAREFDRVALEFNPEANKRDSIFWIGNRRVPLDDRGFETYEYIDSVGEEMNLDKYVMAFAALTTGQIPIRSINLDIDRFLDFNQYEAVRVGLGFHTNQNFSKTIRTGGYVGYGFKDNEIKFGGDVSIHLTDKNELSLFGKYENDIKESGGTNFYLDKNPLSTELNRRFMLLNFDEFENIEGGIRFYFLKYLDVSTSFSVNSKKVTTNYAFLRDLSDPATSQSDFEFSEFNINIKYSFREKFVEVFGKKVSLGTRYPVVWFNYIHGFDNVSKGEFEYDKFDLKVQKSFAIRGWGEPTITIKSGIVFGEIPYTNLYNGNGSKVWEIPIEAANSFQTMEMNEFLSDKFVALYLNYKLGKISISKRRSEPELSAITNIGFGELENPQRHINYPFQLMDKGYYESGLLIKNIYKFGIFGLGFGSYYRYGPYSRTQTIDNLAFKLSAGFTL